MTTSNAKSIVPKSDFFIFHSPFFFGMLFCFFCSDKKVIYFSAEFI